MKERLYKNCSLSLLITTLWTLYGFFDYFLKEDKGGWFDGLGSLTFYFYTLLASIGLGIIMLLIRLVIHLRKRSNSIINNFFYILAGIANSYMILIWIICTYFDLLASNIEFLLFILGSMLISGFIIYDVIKNILLSKRLLKK